MEEHLELEVQQIKNPVHQKVNELFPSTLQIFQIVRMARQRISFSMSAAAAPVVISRVSQTLQVHPQQQ